MIPIYIAFLWHLHQPIYWPGENVMETQAAGHYGFSVLTVHLDRTGPYTAWPMDAVSQAMDAGLGSCGAQVSFTGSLMENLDAIEAAGAGFPGWTSGWSGASTWRTSMGNPRIDMVNIGYFHPILPLVGPDDAAVQLLLHQGAVTGTFSGASVSKGMFPPETGFSPDIIPSLTGAGVEWVIVDNIHFDRTLPDYPWRPEGNILPPNRADQVSGAAVSWVSLTGLWAPTPVSVPWGYRPHRVRAIDPETGAESEIIVVPGARYEGNEDARGGFGALNYEGVLSQLEPYNTDPDHPMLVLLHHDGDNYGGGADSYYHSNFASFVSWLGANSDRFVCTTVQDYLDRFPPDPADVIRVEPGSWSGADNGDPEFGKWNGDPGGDGYSPDRNSWAVITAAQNRVHHAGALEPYGSIEDVRAGTGNASARAWHWLMLAETSCYWYWDRSEGGIWDSHPTRAANRAAAEADAVIAAHAGPDPVGPAIYPPQREPYNPGEFEWSAAREPSDFEVWTFIDDVSGVGSAVLRYRLDDDGVLTRDNDLFATGGWCEVPMEEEPFDSETDPLPLYKASRYRAVVSGVENAMVDYYVLAVDGAGNASHSAVRHTWVGSSGGTGPGALDYYPLSPTLYDVVTVRSERDGNLHWGVNGWIRPPALYWPPGTTDFGDGHAVETPMADPDGDAIFEAAVGPFDDPANVVNELDYVIHYADGSWSGTDIFVTVDNDPGEEPHVFIVSPADGQTVSGTWTVFGTASDDGPLSGIDILLDGATVTSLPPSSPFEYAWDTTTTVDGAHRLGALAADAAGHGGSHEVAVEVRNGSGGECVIYTDAWTDAVEDAPDVPVEEAADVPSEDGQAQDGKTEEDAEAADALLDSPFDQGRDQAPDAAPGEPESGCSCAVAE
jgi:hypothetical protein